MNEPKRPQSSRPVNTPQGGDLGTSKTIQSELLSNQMAQERVLGDKSFSQPASRPSPAPRQKPKSNRLLRTLAGASLLAVAGLAIYFGLLAYRKNIDKTRTSGLSNQFGTTSFDLSNLNPNGLAGESGLVVINGNTTVNGGITANSYSGSGADLSNVNASLLNSQPASFYQDANNLTSGTLSDARLSGNVALLNASQAFTGDNTFIGNGTYSGSNTFSGSSSFTGSSSFVSLLVNGTTTLNGAVAINNSLTTTGDVTVGGTLGVNGLVYSWPGVQGNGVLANDGSGNLAWQAVGACATCITDGGNAFGSAISIGTNDANTLSFRTNGSNRLTVDAAGLVGIGNPTPAYALDVNGDVNLAAGNIFRIGGTAICTSGGCAAQSGSGSYIQNGATLQTGVNMNFEVASINSIGGVIQGKSGQISDLFVLRNGNGNDVVNFSNVGLLTLGNDLASPQTGAIVLNDGTGLNGFTSTLNTATLTGSSKTISFPNENGTVCLQASSNCGFATSSGSGNYIQNGTVLQATANFNIQSAAAGSIGGIIRGAVGQTANLQEWQSSAGSALASISSNGSLLVLDAKRALESVSGSGGALRVGEGYPNVQILGPVQIASGVGPTLGTVEKLRVNTPTTVDNLANIIFSPSATTAKAVVIQAITGQTARLLEFQQPGGSVGTYFDKDGVIVMNVGGVVPASQALIFGTTATASATGAIRLNNTNSISWRNASNNGDKSISISSAAGPTDALLLPLNTVLGGSDATAGALYFFNSAVSVNRTAASGLSLKTTSIARITINDGTSTGSVGIAVPEYFTGGAVEKLRINTPTTTDALANVIFSTSATTSKGLVVQGTASQTANLQEWQASDAQILAKIGQTGNLTIGTNTSTGANGNGTLTLQGYYSGGSTATSLTLTGGGSDALITNSGGNAINIKPTLFLQVLNGFNNNVPFSVNTRSGTQSFQTKVTIQSAGSTGLVVNGATTQTGDLQQFTDVNGAVLSRISANGGIVTNGVSNTLGNLSAPTIGSTSTLTTGGTLAQNTTYWYQMTATNAAGETIGSASASQLTGNTTATNTITLNWTQIAGATGYKIYRNASNSFGSGSLLLTTLTNGTTITYVDTGSATTAGFPPTTPTGTKLVVQGWGGQTSNLQEWQDSGGVAQAKINSTGSQLYLAQALMLESAGSETRLWAQSGRSLSLIADAATKLTISSNRTAFAGNVVYINSAAANTAGTVENFRVNTPTTVDNLANVIFGTSATTSKGLVIQGLASQSANLQEWQSSTGSVLAKVSSVGAVSSPTFNATPTGTSTYSVYYTPTDTNLVRNSAYWGSNIAYGISYEPLASSATQYANGFGVRIGNLFSSGVTSGNYDILRVYENSFNPVSGSSQMNGIDINPIIAQSGTASGITRGLLINPTLTSAVDFRAIEIANASGKGLWQTGASVPNYFAGNVGIGSSATAGTVEKLRVNTPTTVDNLANVIFGTSATTSKGLVVQGAASQSANLQEWQDSAGVAPTYIDSSGLLFAKTTGIKLGFNQKIQAEYSSGGSFADIAWRGASNDIYLGAGADVRLGYNSTYTMIGSGGWRLYSSDLSNTSTGSNTIGGGLPVGQIFITSPTSTVVPQTIKAGVSQTADLTQWKNSAGTVMTAVQAGGSIAFGATPATTGAIRFTGTGSYDGLYWRNTANTADIAGLTSDGTNMIVGTSGTNVGIPGLARIGTATGTQGTLEKLRVAGIPTTLDNSANVMFVASQASAKPLVIQGAVSQSGNLQEWQDSTGAVLASMTANGDLNIMGGHALYSFGTGNPTTADAKWGNFYNSGSTTRFLTSGKGAYSAAIPDMYFDKYNGTAITTLMMIQASSGNTGIGTTAFGTNNRLIVNPYSTVDNLATAQVNINAATNKGLVIQGLAGQSANLFETQTSAGVANFVIYYDGTLRTNGNGFQFWKDNTPSKAVNVGMAVPGSANGDNLVFSAYSGSAWSEKARITNSSGTLEIGSTGAPGTVEKLRVNTPTTVDNLANVMFTTDVATSKGLVIQGAASQAAALLSLQNSSGTQLAGIKADGTVTAPYFASLSDTGVFLQAISGGGMFMENRTSTSNTVFYIKGIASQTGDLQQWKDSSATVLGSIGATGAVLHQNSTNSTSAFKILDSGGTNNVIVADTTNARVGIGTGTAAPTVTLDVLSAGADATTVAQFKNAGATSCTVQPGGTGFACSSDARLKTNVLTLDNASDIVSKLRGVSFNWITNPNGQGQSGFIAQELEQLIPNAVSTDSNGYKVANYSAIIPYLVEALKQQQTDITALKAGQTPQGGTSVDVLKILADAKVVSLSGDLTVGGNVVVKGRLETGGANSGVVIIPAGQTTIHVAYPQAFTVAPRPSLTPKGVVKTYFGVTNETKTGFDIELSDPLTTDSQFNWQAL